MIARTHLLSRILLLAAWFGIVTGLVEGSGLLLFQKLGWLSWSGSLWAVSSEIIWISAFFDLLLFGVIGLLIAAAARFSPRLPVMRVAVFSFAFLMFFDWLALTGRIRHFGVLFLAAGLATVVIRWFRRHEPAALRLWRRTLPWVAAAAALALVGTQGGSWLRERLAIARLPKAAPNAPNILVIVVDTLRADHLSSYGYSRSTSPNLDQLAQQGVLFENAIATSSWTLPSHASLLTGRFPYEHGAERDVYDGRYRTLAEALRARGYRTGAFSANFLFFTRTQGFGSGFMRFEDYYHSIGDMAVRTLYGREFSWFVLRVVGLEDYPARRPASDVNRSVLRWIKNDRDRPFFTFLNYFDVHDPYLPRQPYRSKFSKLKNPGGLVNGWMFHLGPIIETLTPEQLQGETDAYDGAIAYVDNQIGELLGELERSGVARNTVVVITSDHGEEFAEHNHFAHGHSLYRELIHVPFIFWQPGRIPAGMRVAQPVTLAALPATLMELVGLESQTLFPGPSLVQLWKAPQVQSDWPYPLAERLQFGPTKEDRSTLRSLVSPRWHFIVSTTHGPELYDWLKDPRETNNLAVTPEGESVARHFADRLQALLSQPRSGNGGSQQMR